ncbi:TPM domain-containing protein, partial [Asticcacaulis biprosthecium]|uniref:TPM domain-containing protein n=1 Tax=Asticcacaulis biprosthecium TaxID=76891 RepID=UPI00058B433B
MRRTLTSLPALGILLSALLCFAASAYAAPKFPAQNNTRVVDEAGILSPQTERDLDEKLRQLEEKTTDQVVVVTVKDLGDYPIEDYGYQLGRAWGIGQKGQIQADNGQTYKDNGVILLVAPNDRKVRIEVGYGLEPVLPDILMGRVVRDVILPEFQAGNFDAGVTKGADVIVQTLSMERGAAIEQAKAATAQKVEIRDQKKGGFPFGVIIVILIVLFM